MARCWQSKRNCCRKVRSQSVWWTECTQSRANYQTQRHESTEARELIKKPLWSNLEGWPVPPNALASVPAAVLVKRALSVTWACTCSCVPRRRWMCNATANGCLEPPPPAQNNPAFQSRQTERLERPGSQIPQWGISWACGWCTVCHWHLACVTFGGSAAGVLLSEHLILHICNLREMW